MLGGAKCSGNAQKEADWWAVMGRMWEAAAEFSLGTVIGATNGIWQVETDPSDGLLVLAGPC